jgi:hypothetical protein
MDVTSINLDKVNFDINQILSDIKPLFESEQNSIQLMDSRINPVDLQNACKIFGVRNDK